ncbi:TonB-dependent receptor [Massilibacteroides vaginae]|uniref:TonB-dependent receptor n=1 Tax=Massilibacteroides vaginae TaxID=1673718 RepID=UPI000A1CC255|nr:TonB-dependent receptor [Massilibacteroides vaginae]
MKTFIITFLFTANYICAQNIQIKGLVKLEDDTAVEFANVVLRTIDSVFVTGASTDLKGQFLLTNVTPGDYKLIISSIGYQDITELIGVTETIDLGVLTMREGTEVLNEITITAQNIVNKSDRKLIFPNQKQMEASTNGVNLLQTLQLPRLNVDVMNNTVSLSTKEPIQLRINGVKVSEQELMALQPQDVLRIEYIENPGMRYENAGAVINYIVRRHKTGGIISFNVIQSPYKVMGNYNLSAKLSYKKSEFGINYLGMNRKFNNVWRENEERFIFEDGRELIKEEIAEPGDLTNNAHRIILNYNIQPDETNYFNVTAGYYWGLYSEDYYSKLKNSWHPEQITQMTDWTSNKTDRPWVDLYWSHSFENKQSLILNAVGTYIRSENDRTYREEIEKKMITDISSLAEGDKYSLISEAIYEKAWEKGRLSAGLKHIQASVDNKYSGSMDHVNKMKEANTYAYMQYAGKINKVDYTAGVGVYRAWLKQKGIDEYEAYTFRPTVSLTYAPVDKFFVRLNASIENYSPSLADISSVDQYIDSLQIRRGNPELKPYDYYKFSLNSEYRFGNSSLSLWGMYMSFPDAIMEETYREGNWFIRTNEHQKHLHQLMGSLTFKTRFLRDIINLSLTGGSNYFLSEGYTYRHNYTNLYYRASLFINYKQWSLMYEQYNSFNTFWGEQVNGGENVQNLMLNFKHKDWVFGAGMFNPFSTTKHETRNYNQYASFRKVNSVEDASRMFVLQLSWNMNFGRKQNGVQKKLNNTDTDSGIMSTGK